MQDWERELSELAAKNKGLVRPADVVLYAEDESTALHSKFQWDDRKAGHAYRLWQARQLISVAVIVLPGEKEKTYRAYVSMLDDRGNENGGYRMTVDVLSNAKARRRLLAEAAAELARWTEKYEMLEEFAAVFAASRKVRSEIQAESLAAK